VLIQTVLPKVAVLMVPVAAVAVAAATVVVPAAAAERLFSCFSPGCGASCALFYACCTVFFYSVNGLFLPFI
jgi:hypothetical protein